MKTQSNDIGIIGLGVMGRNLALNVADHGFTIVGYDKDASQVEKLGQASQHANVNAIKDLKVFVRILKLPRVVMLLVPAGKLVDSVIAELKPHLSQGDIIIDGGNSFFKDTDYRQKELAKAGIHLLGVGISGGEAGARRGPSIMPGGPHEAYERVRPIFEAVAAQVGGDPCVSYLGPGAAGHAVKMIHNGIEYGLMQLLAESYDLLKRGVGMDNDELHQVFAAWNKTELNSYLIEITAPIFIQTDERKGERLIDVILDVAKQKGTGMWTSREAMEFQAPAPTIDTAVTVRNLSMRRPERQLASEALTGPSKKFDGDRKVFSGRLRAALYAAMIITYAQGMELLTDMAESYGYELNLEDVARIWRGGCIIRASLLEKIRAAYQSQPSLHNLLVHPDLAGEVIRRQDDLRAVACAAAMRGIPAPGFMSALGYYDSYRSAWLPANLIQAQRDYFGGHTYERVDEKGVFHTEWNES